MQDGNLSSDLDLNARLKNAKHMRTIKNLFIKYFLPSLTSLRESCKWTTVFCRQYWTAYLKNRLTVYTIVLFSPQQLTVCVCCNRELHCRKLSVCSAVTPHSPCQQPEGIIWIKQLLCPQQKTGAAISEILTKYPFCSRCKPTTSTTS